MKKLATFFLQLVLVMIAIGAIAFLIREPRVEGVNIGATLYQIYTDPFVRYGYIASIPFFVILYKVCRLLGYVRQNKIFSQTAVQTLQTIQYCALAMIAFVIGGEIWIMLTHGNDDATGAFFMGVLITGASLIIAAGAKVVEGTLKSAVE